MFAVHNRFRLICNTILIAVCVVSVCIAVHFAMKPSQFSEGSSQAVLDWSTGKSTVEDLCGAMDAHVGGVECTYRVDRKSGLWFRNQYVPLDEYMAGYNGRTRQLLEVHGAPPWSMAGKIPEPDELASALESDEMIELTRFPISLGTGLEASMSGDGLDVLISPKNGSPSVPIHHRGGRVWWMSGTQDSGLTFVRIDKSRVYVFDGGCNLICDASSERGESESLERGKGNER